MSKKSNTKNENDESKRDFLLVSTYALAGVGAASFVWPLIDQMNPAAVSYTHLTLPTTPYV